MCRGCGPSRRFGRIEVEFNLCPAQITRLDRANAYIRVLDGGSLEKRTSAMPVADRVCFQAIFTQSGDASNWTESRQSVGKSAFGPVVDFGDALERTFTNV